MATTFCFGRHGTDEYLRRQEGDNTDLVKSFKNKWYAISTHAHTHPIMVGKNAHPIGLSQADLNMQKFVGAPINILYNKGIYSVDGTYNYKQKVWNYKYLGTW